MAIDTALISEKYRARCVDPMGRRLLVTDFRHTQQEKDLTEPANCGGIGRVRHFRRETSSSWPANGLPIDPACKALALPYQDVIRAQVFQNAACNWRCWYCFVPFSLLGADPKHSTWVTPAQLLDRYLDQPERPAMIDLTGGEPSLLPEWVPWMMEELTRRGLQDSVYLWSDDNLSNEYYWTVLSDAERDRITTYPKYGRVCCFKGIDAESFAFNTGAAPAEFELQFERMRTLIGTGMDLYAYVTLTTPAEVRLAEHVRGFVDRLQAIDVNLPLRTIPLEVRPFSPVRDRLNDQREQAMRHQQAAIRSWNEEIFARFDSEQRRLRICDVPWGNR